MKNRIAGSSIGLLVAVIFSSGCAHELTVKNLRTYQNHQINPLCKPLTIGVVQSSGDEDLQQLVNGVGTALQRNSATVVLPYRVGQGAPADVVASIAIRPEYKGSGWNFLINWPGFLVWAPAWNGYVYKANYDVQIVLTKGSDNSKISSWSMPIKLDLRQAEIDRTWTEIGWLEWGITPLIGGFVFIRYDTDVTPILLDKIEAPIGEYIAKEIIARINNSGQFASLPAAMAQQICLTTATDKQ